MNWVKRYLRIFIILLCIAGILSVVWSLLVTEGTQKRCYQSDFLAYSFGIAILLSLIVVLFGGQSNKYPFIYWPKKKWAIILYLSSFLGIISVGFAYCAIINLS